MSVPNHSQPLEISRQDARRFMLAHHSLWPPRRLKGKEGVLSILERLGSIQFDSINVVARNADLVLQSRITGYRPALLEEMLYSDRCLIDGWDKVASIFPIQDWPYFSRRRAYMQTYHQRRSAETAAVLPEMLDNVRQTGPTSSIDFKDQPKVDWYWSETKLARAALEALFEQGRVGINHRVNTRRHFDLIERLVPAELLDRPDPFDSLETYHDWHVLRRIGGMGLASATGVECWLGIVNHNAALRRNNLARLVEQGQIVEVRVEGLGKEVLYIRSADLPLLENIQTGRAPKAQAAFIAPLDNLMWQRKLIQQLFGFDYIWEVYKPKPQRKWGYYVLPVIYGDRFIARFDPAVDRKNSTLAIKGFWWEEGIEPDGKMTAALQTCVKNFMQFAGTQRLELADELTKDPVLRQLS